MDRLSRVLFGSMLWFGAISVGGAVGAGVGWSVALITGGRTEFLVLDLAQIGGIGGMIWGVYLLARVFPRKREIDDGL
jgi:hypothetical protein